VSFKDPSSGESSRGSSRAPSTSCTEYLSSLTPVVRLDGRPSPTHDFSLRLPLTMPDSSKMTPGKPREVSAEDWKLFQVYWEGVPRKIYPYEDIMRYNPSRAPEFYWSMLEVGGTSWVHCEYQLVVWATSANSRRRCFDERLYQSSRPQRRYGHEMIYLSHVQNV
jgi:hypothetical protein